MISRTTAAINENSDKTEWPIHIHQSEHRPE